ncbi:MAG: class I SAM-dependent methyltransferase [Candidatus Lokiarchaeota archaeon]|nr:class I SAM-dependent methyltransferase [Candidatus Lokiarchaeota archaeon]
MTKMLNQCRKPKGRFGRIMAKGMNKGPHAKMAVWSLNHISVKPNDIILDIGCGGGGNVNKLAKIAIEGKVYGIDNSEISVEISKKVNKELIENGNVEIQHASVSSLPFNENTFDLVTGYETYYFWPDLINDLKGIYKVLKPGGILALINEGYKSENEKYRKRNEKWAKIGNFEIHTPEQFKEFLTKAVFSEIEIFTEKNKGWIIVKGKKNYGKS